MTALCSLMMFYPVYNLYKAPYFTRVYIALPSVTILMIDPRIFKALKG